MRLILDDPLPLNMCSSSLLELRDGDGQAVYIQQKELPPTITHNNKVYYYCGVQDGRGYYNTIKQPLP